jgi:hypothetical protein
MASGYVENIDVWQHAQAKDVVNALAAIISARDRLVWRRDYLCCGSSKQNTIPEIYITEAFQRLGIEGSVENQTGLCIYVPGGLQAMQLNHKLHPILVHVRSVNSGTHESSTT